MAEYISKNIQYSRSGDINPNDIIIGVKGETFHNYNDGTVFECLGGLKWTLIEDEKRIINREVYDESTLTKLGDIKLGEKIKIDGRGASVKAVYVEEQINTILEYTDGVRKDAWTITDLSLNGGDTFNVGDKIKVKYKLYPFTGVSPTTTWRGISIGTKNFGFRLSESTPQTPQIGATPSEISLVDTRNEDGDFFHKSLEFFGVNSLDINKWLVSEFEVVSPLTQTSVSLVTQYNSGCSWEVEWFEVRGEIFDFKNINGSNQVIGSLGSVMQWEDILGIASSPITTIRNDGNDNDIISFSSGADFKQYKVKPENGFVTPQMYGAVSCGNIEDPNAVDCTAAFQAAIDSPYSVYVPNGYYLITDTLKILKPKTITGTRSIYYITTPHDNPSASVLFTKNTLPDRPIDFIDITSSNVYITLSFDVSLCTFDPTVINYRRPSIVRHWCKNNVIIHGGVNISVKGSTKTLNQQANSGYDVSQIEGSTPRTDIITASDGEMHKIVFDIHASGINSAVYWSSLPPYNTETISSNTNEFIIRANKCKRSVYNDGTYGRGCTYDINHQYGNVLHYSEPFIPGVEIGSSGSEYRIHSHDPGTIITDKLPLSSILTLTGTTGQLYVSTTSGVDDASNTVNVGDCLKWTGTQWEIASSGLTNSIICAINEKGNQILNNSFYGVDSWDDRVILRKDIKTSHEYSINPKRFTLTEQKNEDWGDPFIAELHDFLSGADDKFTISAEVFDNDGTFDFTTELTKASVAHSSLSDGSSLVTLSNLPSNLFKVSTVSTISTITYNAGFSSLNEDFVEIRVENIGNIDTTELRRLIIAFSGSNYPNKVQIIRVDTTNGSKQNIYDTSEIIDSDFILSKYFTSSENNVDDLIIRLIGEQSGNVGATVKIERIHGACSNIQDIHRPYIKSYGDQRLFGSLEVDSLSLSNDYNPTSIIGYSPANYSIGSVERLVSRVTGTYPNNLIGSNKNAASFFNKELGLNGITATAVALEVKTDEIEPYVRATSFINGTLSKLATYYTNKVTVSGALYHVSFQLRCGVGNTYARFGNFSGFTGGFTGTYLSVLNEDWQTYSFVMVGNGSSTAAVRFYSARVDVDGAIIDFKNVRVEKIEKETQYTNVRVNQQNRELYYFDVPSSSTSHKIGSTSYGGKAAIAINAASKPTISALYDQITVTELTGLGDTFVPNTDMIIYLDCYDGINVHYYFKHKIQNYSSTGTSISLDSNKGRFYNMSAASAATTYTTVNLTVGGNAVCLVNAATEPTITGATKVKGSTFIPNTDMHMVVWYYGVTVQYNFIEL